MSSFHGAPTRFSTLDTMANIDTSFSNLGMTSVEPQQQAPPPGPYRAQYLDTDAHQGQIMFTGTNYDEQDRGRYGGPGLPDGVGGRQRHTGSMLADFDTSTNPDDYTHSRASSGIVATSRSRRDGTIGAETRVGADEDHLNNFLNRETSIARRYQSIQPGPGSFDEVPGDQRSTADQRGASGVLLHPMPMLHHEARGSDYDPQNVPGHRRPRADFYPTTDRLMPSGQQPTMSQQQYQIGSHHQGHQHGPGQPPCPVHARTPAPWAVSQGQQRQQQRQPEPQPQPFNPGYMSINGSNQNAGYPSDPGSSMSMYGQQGQAPRQAVRS